MTEFVTTINFGTDFPAPCDCPHDGDVRCRVLFSDCQVIDRWDKMLTFKVKLILRITVEHGRQRCSFDREIVLKESVWFDGWLDLLNCDVKAAVCRCVINQGWLCCNGTVAVRIEFCKPTPLCLCRCNPCRCNPCDPCDHGWDDGCGCDGGLCDRHDHCSPCACGGRRQAPVHTFSCKPVRVSRP